MNGLFNNNFLVGMLIARDLPKQDQFLSGLAAAQMQGDSMIGPLLLQPLVSRLATAENGRATAESGRETAESNAKLLQRRLEVELPLVARTATLRVPGASTASFSRVSGTDGTTVDGTTGVVALTEHGEQTIAIAVDGTAREVTIVNGPRTATGETASRTLADATLDEFVQAFVAALSSAKRTDANPSGDVPARTREVAPNADRSPPARAATPPAPTTARAPQRGSEGSTSPTSGAKSSEG